MDVHVTPERALESAGTSSIELAVPEGASGELSIGRIVDGGLAELDVWTAVE